jgi:hypothetical protein
MADGQTVNDKRGGFLKWGAAALGGVVLLGVIDAIELDLLDNPVVRFSIGPTYEFVQAKFAKDDAAAVGVLTKGQAITVKCASVIEVIGNPILQDCKLL